MRSSGNTDIRGRLGPDVTNKGINIAAQSTSCILQIRKKREKIFLHFIFEAYSISWYTFATIDPLDQTKQFNVLQRFSPSRGAIRQDLHQSAPSQCWEPSRAFLRSEDQTELMFHSPVAFLLWNMMKGFNIKLNTASKRLIARDVRCQNQFPDTREWWESALNTGSLNSI